MKRLFPVIYVVSCLIAAHSFAGSATWNLNPTSGNWNTAGNWTPATVPNNPNDIATFGLSNVTSVSTEGEFIELNSVVFEPNASAFTISVETQMVTVSGSGIVNDSGVTQNFAVTAGGVAEMIFAGSASAGSSTVFTNQGGGTIAEAVTYFLDDASAGNASFVNQAATDSDRPQPGGTVFFDNATAANGTFVNQGSGGGNGPGNIAFYDNSTAANGFFACDGAVSDDGTGGGVNFLDTASGGDATFILSGSDFDGAEGAFISFLGTSTAGNATLTANGGPVADSGALIQFLDDSKGDTARVEVFDNGNLNISGHKAPGVTVGSIEGSGNVFLGANNLTVGSNNLSTTFSGVIQGGGSFSKIGRGRLVLTGDNHYNGKTIIKKGHLVINNSQGSGSGNGPVILENGTLGGRGAIGGSVTIGNGVTGDAVLAPGKNADTPQTLTVRRSLGFSSNGNYHCSLNSNDKVADAIVAHGVTIGGASFFLQDVRSTVLTPGLVFIVINNTATTPINGSFINMPDGSGISAGFNTFEANYEGGDGNDLTLTVVP